MSGWDQSERTVPTFSRGFEFVSSSEGEKEIQSEFETSA